MHCTASFLVFVSPLFHVCPLGAAYHIIEAHLIIVCQCDEEITDPMVTVCPKCNANVPLAEEGPKQEAAPAAQPTIVINNSNNNVNTNTNNVGVGPKPKNKWVAFLLCLFLGFIGAHKFYEGKYLMGVLYIFTFGLFIIGWAVDAIAILMKPNPYYV